MILSPTPEQLVQSITTRFPQPVIGLENRKRLSISEDLTEHYWYAPELVVREGLQEDFPDVKRVAVYFNCDLPSADSDDYWIIPSVCELIGNCTDKGATFVYVIYSQETHQLLVRDDIKHSVDEISALLEKLNAYKVKSTKLPEVDGRVWGGVGIASIRRGLDEHTGKLTYYENRGGIVAVMDWNSE